MKLQVTSVKVIPNQSLDDKLLYLASIKEVFPCDEDGGRLENSDFKKAERVRYK